MKYKINYIIRGKQGSFIVKGDLELIRPKIYDKLKKLGVDLNHNDFWSEKID